MTTATPKETPEDFNPYRAPKSNLDMPPEPDTGEWLRSGRVVPAKNGLLWIREAWRLITDRPGLWIPALLPVLALECVQAFSDSVWLSSAALLCLLPLCGSASVMAERQMRGEPGAWFDIFALCRGRLGQLLLLGLLVLACMLVLPIAVNIALGLLGYVLIQIGLPPAVIPSALVGVHGLILACALLGGGCAPTLVMLAKQNAWQAFCHSLGASLRNWRALLTNGLTPLLLFLNLAPVLILLVTLQLGAGPEDPTAAAETLAENAAWTDSAAVKAASVAIALFSVLMDFVATRDLFHNAPNAPLSEPCQQTITTGLPHEHD